MCRFPKVKQAIRVFFVFHVQQREYILEQKDLMRFWCGSGMEILANPSRVPRNFNFRSEGMKLPEG